MNYIHEGKDSIVDVNYIDRTIKIRYGNVIKDYSINRDVFDAIFKAGEQYAIDSDPGFMEEIWANY